mgnify:FL=1
MNTKKLTLVIVIMLGAIASVLPVGINSKTATTPPTAESLSIETYQASGGDFAGEQPPAWYRVVRRRHLTTLTLYIAGFSTVIIAGLVFVLF